MRSSLRRRRVTRRRSNRRSNVRRTRRSSKRSTRRSTRRSMRRSAKRSTRRSTGRPMRRSRKQRARTQKRYQRRKHHLSRGSKTSGTLSLSQSGGTTKFAAEHPDAAREWDSLLGPSKSWKGGDKPAAGVDDAAAAATSAGVDAATSADTPTAATAGAAAGAASTWDVGVGELGGLGGLQLEQKSEPSGKKGNLLTSRQQETAEGGQDMLQGFSEILAKDAESKVVKPAKMKTVYGTDPVFLRLINNTEDRMSWQWDLKQRDEKGGESGRMVAQNKTDIPSGKTSRILTSKNHTLNIYKVNAAALEPILRNDFNQLTYEQLRKESKRILSLTSKIIKTKSRKDLTDMLIKNQIKDIEDTFIGTIVLSNVNGEYATVKLSNIQTIVEGEFDRG